MFLKYKINKKTYRDNNFFTLLLKLSLTYFQEKLVFLSIGMSMFKKISNIFKRQSYDIIKLQFNTFGEKLLIEICDERVGNENISVTPPIILLAFYMLLLGPDTKTKR